MNVLDFLETNFRRFSRCTNVHEISTTVKKNMLRMHLKVRPGQNANDEKEEPLDNDLVDSNDTEAKAQAQAKTLP